MSRRPIACTMTLLLATCAHGQEPITLKGHGGWVGAVAFSPDSRRLAIGASDGSVNLWDLKAGKKIAELKGHEDAVAALAFSANGKLLVSGGHDGFSILYDIGSDAPAVTRRLGQRGAVLSIALTQDAKRLFAGSIDTRIYEYNVDREAFAIGFKDHTSWVNGLAIDREEKWLASASSDNSLKVRRLKDLELTHTFRVKEGEMRAVAFSPDGKLIAAGIRYGGVRVWRLDDKKEVAALKAHTGETWAVAFTPDGKTLASGGGDWNKPGEVRLWDVGAWKERATLKHTGEVLCLTISPNGHFLAAGSWDRSVKIWDLTRLPRP